MHELQWNSLYVTNVIIDAAALVISAILALRIVQTRRKITEHKMYFGLCVMNIVLSIADTIEYIFLIIPERPGPAETVYKVSCDPVIGIISLVMVAQWMLFVEYDMHQSPDEIRRVFRRILIPFYVSVFIELGRILLYAQGMKNEDYKMLYAGDNAHIVTTIVMFLYLVLTYVIVYQERVRKKLPRYIAITPMTVTVFLGFVLDAVTEYSLITLSFALGSGFMLYSLKIQAGWEDFETGYYNESYIKVITDHINNNKIKGGTLIRFMTKDDSTALAEILHDMEPEDSKTVFMDDGTFLVITGTQTVSVIERYIKLITERAQRKDIEVNAEYFTRTDESPEEFLASCLTGSGISGMTG